MKSAIEKKTLIAYAIQAADALSTFVKDVNNDNIESFEKCDFEVRYKAKNRLDMVVLPNCYQNEGTLKALKKSVLKLYSIINEATSVLDDNSWKCDAIVEELKKFARENVQKATQIGCINDTSPKAEEDILRPGPCEAWALQEDGDIYKIRWYDPTQQIAYKGEIFFSEEAAIKAKKKREEEKLVKRVEALEKEVGELRCKLMCSSDVYDRIRNRTTDIPQLL